MSPMQYDWKGSERPSVAIVETVAAVTDRDPLDLPPLYDRVDVGALDALMTSTADGSRTDARISFSYAGCGIIVERNGTVAVSVDTSEYE